MKQKILDELARLNFQEEKCAIKKYKSLISQLKRRAGRRIDLLGQIAYHKEQLMLAKRMLPMRPVLADDGILEEFYCPCCRLEVPFLAQHCEECGQRIMW